MAKLIAKVGVKKESGFLYFIDKQGNAARAKMARGRKAGGKKKVAKKAVRKAPAKKAAKRRR